jgi:bifunctional non-homologous end joining protein LigD
MITPMVARLIPTPFDRPGWLFKLKWDGFRAIAEKDKQGVRLYSRKQNDFKTRFPVIAEAVGALDKVILDGEVCALDDHGHPRFEWLLNRGRQRGKLVYSVFDLLRLGDIDLRGEPLFRRKKLLAKILRKNDTLRYVDHVENDGLPMFAGAIGAGAREEKGQREVGESFSEHNSQDRDYVEHSVQVRHETEAHAQQSGCRS